MNVQFARGSGVATITLSADEIDRFMASSRGIVNEIRLALLEAMQVADRESETVSKRKQPARISFARSPQEIDKLRRRGRTAESARSGAVIGPAGAHR